MPALLTLAVAVTWAVLALALCGIGVALLGRLTGLEPNWANAYLAVWAGFALLMAGLLLWNFFLAVNERTLWLVAALAAVALILERRWFQALWSQPRSPWLALAIAAFAIWVANHALAPGLMDDFNYEFRAVRWFHDYPVVPGLANLNGRIGFNNSHHLFAALLSFGPWSGGVNHLFNGFFVVLAFTLLAASVRELARGRIRSWALLGALFVSPCVGLVLFSVHGALISTLKADLFVCAAAVTMAILFVEFAETPSRSDRHLALGATILLLSAALFSVKFSAVVFSGVVAVAVLVRLLATAGWRHRVTLSTASIAAVIVCSVLARGVIISGYPLYPSSILPMRVDWRVPAAQVDAERAFITSWAQLRATYDPSVVHGWGWVPNWAQTTILTDKFDIILPLTLTVFCLLLLAFSRRGNSPEGVPRWAWATLIGASLLSLSVWFLQAPAGRFAFVYFWILFAVVFTLAVKRWPAIPRSGVALAALVTFSAAAYLLFFVLGVPREFRADMLLTLGFGGLWIAASSWAFQKKRFRLVAAFCLALGFFQISDRILAHALRRRFDKIAPMVWLNIAVLPERVEKLPYVPRRLRQGSIVFEAREAGYDMPLPNTRYFNPSLELRAPGDLSKGFRNPDYLDPAKFGYSVRVLDPLCCEQINPD